jgi:DNA polymerase
MKDVRGQILEYRGKKLMITYQPAALLRNPNLKRPVWEDMKKLKSLLDN